MDFSAIGRSEPEVRQSSQRSASSNSAEHSHDGAHDDTGQTVPPSANNE